MTVNCATNKVETSAYIIESQNVWHERLEHVNYDTMCKLINMNLIPKFAIDSQHKCEACVEAKIHRKSYNEVLNHWNLYTLTCVT